MARPKASQRRLRLGSARFGSLTPGMLVLATDASLPGPNSCAGHKLLPFGAAAVTSTGEWYAMNGLVTDRPRQFIADEAELIIAITALAALSPEQSAILITDSLNAARALDEMRNGTITQPAWVDRDLPTLPYRPQVKVMWQSRFHQLITVADEIARIMRSTRKNRERYANGTSELTQRFDAIMIKHQLRRPNPAQ